MKREEKNSLEILQQDISLPQIVDNRIEDTLTHIKTETPKENNIMIYKKKHKMGRKRWAITAAAATLILGTITSAAAYMHWSRGLSDGLGVKSEQQKTALEDMKLTSPIGQTITDNGVTVTVQQSIVDNYFAYISFKVDGYTLKDGAQPDFEKMKLTIDGKQDQALDETSKFSAVGDFYNGVAADDNQNVTSYIDKDGSLEYIVAIDASQDKGALLNKDIHVELQNLGTVEQAAYANEVDGSWAFDWTLSGSDEMKDYTLNKKISDTGANVTNVSISPMSVYAQGSFPRQEKEETVTEAEGIDGKETTAQEKMMVSVEAPQLVGVKLKDGTVYTNLVAEPGATGYLDDATDVYTQSFSFNRILDVDQIDSLLYLKDNVDTETLSEDNCYVIPLK